MGVAQSLLGSLGESENDDTKKTMTATVKKEKWWLIFSEGPDKGSRLSGETTVKEPHENLSTKRAGGYRSQKQKPTAKKEKKDLVPQKKKAEV